MPKRMFEFQCMHGHVHEALTEYEQKIHQCPHCDCLADRIISTPRINLEGITGTFQTAADAWARKHEEAAKQAKKRLKEHGVPSRLLQNP